MAKNTCLAPPVTVLVKLGSLAVHAEEMMSPDGHAYDRIAIEQLLADHELKSWLAAMRSLVMLPVKRKEQPNG